MLVGVYYFVTSKNSANVKLTTITQMYERFSYPTLESWETHYVDGDTHGTATSIGEEGMITISSYVSSVCDEPDGICEITSKHREGTVEEVYQEYIIKPGYCTEIGEESWSDELSKAKIVECEYQPQDLKKYYYITSGPSLTGIYIKGDGSEAFEGYFGKFKKEASFQDSAL